MSPTDKSSRLGRGLDALLARRQPQKGDEQIAATDNAVKQTASPVSAQAPTDGNTGEPLSISSSSSVNPEAITNSASNSLKLGAAAQALNPQRDELSAGTNATRSENAALEPNRASLLTAGSSLQLDPALRTSGALEAESPAVERTSHPTEAESRAMDFKATDAEHASHEPDRDSLRSSRASAPATRIGAELESENAIPALRNSGGATQRAAANGLGYRLLPIASIAPNPFQPRKEFHPHDLTDLESSLRSQGLLQPITVRPSPNHSGYELIAGERRLRAARSLGWKEIPAIVRETNDRTMLTLAMVENLQRADLDPIEEADGYQRLIDDFDATQQEVADVVGKERSTVANALRLLALPASVKRMLQERKITVGHARALLPLETERAMAELARDIVAKSLSVRDVETRVRGTRPSPAKSGRKAKPIDTGVSAGSPAASAELRRIEELLRKKMQTPVNVHLTGKERGEVRITFFSNDDLERVLELLGVNFDS